MGQFESGQDLGHETVVPLACVFLDVDDNLAQDFIKPRFLLPADTTCILRQVQGSCKGGCEEASLRPILFRLAQGF